MMDVAEPASRDAPDAIPGDTFCLYLARQLVARQGFVPGAPADAAEIAAQSDYILSFSDGYSPVIVALIDREAHPDKTFTLSAMRIQEIAKACRALAGRVGMTKMPVTIRLMEVGRATPDQPARLGEIKSSSFFSKLIVSAWAIDPERSVIWDTAGFRGRGMRKLVQNLLDTPRETVVAPEPVALAPHTFPWLTAAIIAVLAAIFAAEIAFGLGGDGLQQPTLATLLAFGGLMGKLVIGSGEWYRLFTAPLLHGGFTHIALNAISLGLAGYVLEPLIGRAWFAALFVIGALCGALLSLTLNSDVIVSVGASGAVMALFACMLVLSQHFPKGGTRTNLQMNAVYVLLPSLLPLASMFKGAKVDYAAHFGGAIGGVALGFALLALWPRDEARPRLRAAALAVAIVGLAGFAAAGALARQNYPVYEMSAALAPQALIPTSNTTAQTQFTDLIARYPRDPRLHFLHAMALLRAKDATGAEQALRTGLAEETVWRRAITGSDLPERMHTILALVVLDGGRKDEAKQIARPACAPGTTAQLRALLDQQKLCE